jgi:DNA invertase Pin-like site-specific DNA recombinase
MTHSHSKKALFYGRTSTRKQDLEGQRRVAAEWAAKNNRELVAFEDDHTSGRRNDRKGIEALLEEAKTGDYDVCAVTELSRIGRSISFICTTVEALSKAGVKIVLINSGAALDYESLEGRALVHALALAADIEWMLAQERSARGRETIKARGIKVGPKLKPISTVVLQALLDQGMSLRKIAVEVGVSPATVMRRVRFLGLKRAS